MFGLYCTDGTGSTPVPRTFALQALVLITKHEFDSRVGLFFVAERLHYHVLLHFDCQVALSTVVKLFGDDSGVHCEVMKGTFEQAKAYCTKDSDRVPGSAVFEWGVPPQQGKRKDIDTVKDVLRAGGGMRDIAERVSSYQALKSGELLLKFFEAKRDWKPEVLWFHGATGTGKTKRAFELFAEKKASESDEAWVSGKNLQWWEGYDAHQFVIFDDFRKDFCTFHELLRILDRYPYRVMTKGGSRQLLAKYIVITCPWKPEVLFNTRSDEDIQQLMRRIDSVELFGEEEVAPPVVASASAPQFRQS